MAEEKKTKDERTEQDTRQEEKLSETWAQDALADLDTLTRFCQSHPEACVDQQFRQEYNFYLEGMSCNFWIRLITRPRDYNLYLNAFAKS